MGFARNHGLDAARGNYIAFADGDDLMESDMLERLHDCCIQQRVNVATCAFSFLDGGGNKTYFHSTFETYESLKKYIKDDIIDLKDHAALGLMFLVTWNMMYHKSVFENLRYAQNYEDLSTSVEILVNEQRIGHVPLPLYYYRLDNPTRMVNNGSPRILDIFHITEVIKSAIYEVIQDEKLARKTYLRIAIRAIRFRGTLARTKAMKKMFWRRTEQFLRQERLDFERLMEGVGYEFSEDLMLDIYRPHAWQRALVKRNYHKSRQRWAKFRFAFDPLLGEFDPVLEIFRAPPYKPSQALEVVKAIMKLAYNRSTDETVQEEVIKSLNSEIKSMGRN